MLTYWIFACLLAEFSPAYLLNFRAPTAKLNLLNSRHKPANFRMLTYSIFASLKMSFGASLLMVCRRGPHWKLTRRRTEEAWSISSLTPRWHQNEMHRLQMDWSYRYEIGTSTNEYASNSIMKRAILP